MTFQSVAALIFVSVARDIQVSGRTDFSESRWREAILFYLFGMWSGNEDVTYRPKIHFGDICLRLDQRNGDGDYYAYGHQEVREDVPALGSDDLVETSGKQAEVEVALIRFVKDDRIRQLRFCFPSVSNNINTLFLWKKKRRGEYGVAGIGLPYAWGTKGPIWTAEDFQKGDWAK